MLKKIILFLFFLQSVVYSYDIYFYVASAMAKPVREIVKIFNSQSKEDKIVLLTGGSGQLLNKIIFSKKGDIYMPASNFFKDKAKKRGIVLKSINFVYQTPVFGLSKRGSKIVKSFKDLAYKNVKIALGNPKTMALGKIYENIKAKMPEDIVNGINKNMVVLAVNVSQIVNYLKTDSVDAGIVFDTVAKMNGLKYIEIPAIYIKKDEVSINLLKFSNNIDKAEAFINYLMKMKKIFKKYGFEVIQK